MSKRCAAFCTALLTACSLWAASAGASYQDALKAYQEKRWPAAFVEANLLAQQGNARGQALLAALYAQGLGVKRDIRQAIKWYASAADQGHPGASFALGLMYLDGRAGADVSRRLGRTQAGRSDSRS